MRTIEEQMEHFAEALAVVQFTRGYTGKQLAEKLYINQPSLWYYLNKKKLPSPESKEYILNRLKEIVTEPKIINTSISRRIYF